MKQVSKTFLISAAAPPPKRVLATNEEAPSSVRQ